jgi:hypothetical protein
VVMEYVAARRLTVRQAHHERNKSTLYLFHPEHSRRMGLFQQPASQQLSYFALAKNLTVLWAASNCKRFIFTKSLP